MQRESLDPGACGLAWSQNQGERIEGGQMAVVPDPVQEKRRFSLRKGVS